MHSLQSVHRQLRASLTWHNIAGANALHITPQLEVIENKGIIDYGPSIDHGGPWDALRTYSPNILYVAGAAKPYRIYYTGGNTAPERIGYRLLLAESANGVTFEKWPTPILPLVSEGKKHYSSKVVQEKDGTFSLYYATNEYGNGYDIRKATSTDGYSFTGNELVVPLAPPYTANIHTLKLATDAAGNTHAYFTGSANSQYFYSNVYKHFDISQQFSLFHFVLNGEPPVIQPLPLGAGFVNDYGHDTFTLNGRIQLITTRTDHVTNCLYLSSSGDGTTFTAPKLLLQPEETKGEMAYYGCSAMLLGTHVRLYYGARYLDNTWRIKTSDIPLSYFA